MSNSTDLLLTASISALAVSSDLSSEINEGSKNFLLTCEKELLRQYVANTAASVDQSAPAAAQVAAQQLDTIDAIQSLINARFIAIRDDEQQAIASALACTTMADHALKDVAAIVGKAGERVEAYLSTLTTVDSLERAELAASAIAAALSKIKIQAAINHPDAKSFGAIPFAKKAISASEYFRDLITKNTGHKVSFSGTGMALTLNQCRVWIAEGSRLGMMPAQGHSVTPAPAKIIDKPVTASGRQLVQSGSCEPVGLETSPAEPVVAEPVVADTGLVDALQALVDVHGFDAITDALVMMELATLEQADKEAA